MGKSTALKRLIAERTRSGEPARRILHASVEGRSEQDVVDIVRRAATNWLEGEPGERLWLIDEITGIQGAWPAMIERLRDSHSSFAADTVVLTGSSSTRFDEARKLLAGRRLATRSDRVLFQMSFADFAGAVAEDLPQSPGLDVSELADYAQIQAIVSEYRPSVVTLVESWDEYLRVGGYPQAVAARISRSEEAEESLLESLWDGIHGEAFAGSGLTQTQTEAILRGLTSSLSSLLSVHALAKAVGIANQTAEQRLDALRRAFVAFPVHREQGRAPKPRSQSKWYLTDPILARLAPRFGAGTAPDVSALSEQQVGLAILRALERRSPGAVIRHDRLLYYRSTTGAEIDFVSPDFMTTCVESKFVDRAWGRAFQTIEASGRSAGIVATRSGMQDHRAGWALPAALIAYVLRS